MSQGLDQVNIAFLEKRGKEEGKVPLVVSPRWDASLGFLANWCQANRSHLDEMVTRHGAVLFRGFDVQTAHDMEVAFQAYQPALNDTYRGTSPRKLMDGAQYVFSAAEVPTNYPIAQHLEMSFLDRPPRQLFFGCLKPSKSLGGETALCDFGLVYEELSHNLKQKFLDKGILYTRTHKKKGTYFTYDVADMLGWPQLFGTEDKAEVEEICAAEGIPVTWTSNDTFVSKFHQTAFQLHPETAEPVWFNHTQVFHWTTFPVELWFAFRRTGDWLLLLHCLFVTLFCVIKYGLLGYKMSLHATFGDGTPISVEEMNEIRQAIHKNMIFTRWQKGDMIFIDNFSMSHGRQPTYDKGRTVVVAWAEPEQKKNAVASVVKTTNVANSNDPVVCMENPQERTPESTLTKQESETLEQDLKKQTSLEEALAKLSSENPNDVPISDKTLQALKNIVAQAEARNAHLMHSRGHQQTVIGPDLWKKED